jgi:hypothetical protein
MASLLACNIGNDLGGGVLYFWCTYVGVSLHMGDEGIFCIKTLMPYLHGSQFT